MWGFGLGCGGCGSRFGGWGLGIGGWGLRVGAQSVGFVWFRIQVLDRVYLWVRLENEKGQDCLAKGGIVEGRQVWALSFGLQALGFVTSDLVFNLFWNSRLGLGFQDWGLGFVLGFQNQGLGFGAGPEASESKNTLEPDQRVQKLFPPAQEGRYQAACKRQFKLAWRKASLLKSSG